MRVRRLMTSLATVGLLCSLVALAPATVGAASAGTARTISRVGTGSATTGSFTPSDVPDTSPFVEEEFPGDEAGADADAGPDPFDGSVSLSSGHAKNGAPTSSAPRAKSNPDFRSGFEGLNHYQQRYSRGGNQFSVEPPDQGMCAGNGFVLETVNAVMNVFHSSDGSSALPDNTDATRDLSIVYGAHGLYLAEVGALDSALAVYGKGQHIAEQLAAADPDNAMEQIDVADGHYEIGTMLSGGGRHEQALGRFRDAAQRYRRLAAADTGNTQLRLSAAMSCRQAGEACQALARRAAGAERERWRLEAIDWLDRSLGYYQPLADAGALVGDDVDAPRAIRARLTALRAGG